MHRLKVFLFAAFAAGSSTASAGNDEVAFGREPSWAQASELLPVPADAKGMIFVRRQDTLVHLDGEGQKTYQNQVFRILHPQALQLGNVAIVWNPAVGAPMVHALRIHREGTVIDVLDTARFEILRREDQLEQAMLDGLLTATLRVPDLRVGDDLEIVYTVPAHDLTLGSDSFGMLFLAHNPAAGRFRLGLSWAEGQQPEISLTPDFAGIAQRGPRSFEIRADNPGAITPPKDAPPRFGWMRVVQYSDFADWAAVSRRFDSIFRDAARLAPDSPVKAEAARIAAAHSGDLARAQAALELVQRQVRYIFVGLNGGNLTPATADETWQRRYGDCKGKTALLLALLAELGIEAEAVLANNAGIDDGFDERLPSPGLFDHVLVRAEIDGQAYWLDGTLPDVAEARTRPALPYRWILPLSAAGSPLEAVPFEPFALPQEMGLYEIDARGGFDQPARIKHEAVTRGAEGLVQYMQVSALTPDQLLTSFRGALAGSGQWDTIESVDYRYDRATQASVLTISGTGPVDWEEEEDGEYWLALPGGGFSPPERRQRATDQNQDAPFYTEPSYSCHATTVRLPEGTDIENWGFNSTFDTKIYGRIYYRMMERRDDGTIRLVRGSRVQEPEISPQLARRGNERLADFDNSKANISYHPNEAMNAWGRLSQVPATYEFDWTGRDAPCLPKDVLAGE